METVNIINITPNANSRTDLGRFVEFFVELVRVFFSIRRHFIIMFSMCRGIESDWLSDKAMTQRLR